MAVLLMVVLPFLARPLVAHPLVVHPLAALPLAVRPSAVRPSAGSELVARQARCLEPLPAVGLQVALLQILARSPEVGGKEDRQNYLEAPRAPMTESKMAN